MKMRNSIVAMLVVALLGAGGYGLYWVGMHRGMNMKPSTPDSAAHAEAGSQKGATGESGKKVLYWHDPMVPGQKFDKPGKSPFMDMQLVPVYADGEGDQGNVTINSRVQQNLGVRTAEVTKGSLASSVEAVGSVAYNERDVALVQARSNGFVEKLYVRAPLDPVRKNQPLAELYVPDWVAAQEEYLSAKRIAASDMGNGLDGLQEGARQRMRLAGMTEDYIRLVESTGAIHPRLTLRAPISGVVTELGAREGMTVMAGAALFRLNGLSTVWVNAEIPETLAAQVRPGNPVEARTTALPGIRFTGRVSAILPEVNLATRTLKARVELANPGNRLLPGMFAMVNFASPEREEMLLVPTEAVIQTGTRSVVIVTDGENRFVPIEVETGLEAGGRTEIRKGLEAGQKVVVSSQFLIDSEASLKGTTTRMGEMPALQSGKPEGVTHHGEGKVERIGKEEVTLSHGPIPSLQWGPMTMGFKLPASGLPKNVAVGDTVAFEIRQTKDGMYEITSISSLRPATAQPMKDDMTGEMHGPQK